ncbi:hypothetical protein BpHYR1_052978 [Brachionus plicatilis]|uniref:Uncharacterized protein n=1 Tax=Brachionus plicatilis TaxID=10195 RepID=A0A3M7S1W5_BRAPC|nr:hypothetical protein BpHYR1_052978 [Brachionus plicatilis]
MSSYQAEEKNQRQLLEILIDSQYDLIQEQLIYITNIQSKNINIISRFLHVLLKSSIHITGCINRFQIRTASINRFQKRTGSIKRFTNRTDIPFDRFRNGFIEPVSQPYL